MQLFLLSNRQSIKDKRNLVTHSYCTHALQEKITRQCALLPRFLVSDAFSGQKSQSHRLCLDTSLFLESGQRAHSRCRCLQVIASVALIKCSQAVLSLCCSSISACLPCCENPGSGLTAALPENTLPEALHSQT